MADNDTSTFKLDLDNEDFVNKAKQALDSIISIGASSESVGALTAAFGELAPVLLAVAAAGYGAKVAFETILDAEQIEQTSIQFQSLANSAGQFSGELLEGLKKASAGWVDETTLMKAANKSLVELQTGTEKLPELMELARKTTLVMGGDVITTFSQISQAVASGNAKQLRSLGITIDQQKAFRDYAGSVGITVDALSQADRQQALMNAALEEGNKKFGQNQTDVRNVTNEWNKFKSTITELKETFELVFDHVFGPAVQKVLQGVNYLTSAFSKFSKSTVEYFGFEKKHIEEHKALQDQAAHGDQERLQKNAAEQLKIREKLNQEEIAGEARVAQSTKEADRLYMEGLKAQGDAVNAQIKEIEAKRAQHLIGEEEANQQIILLRKIRNQKMAVDDLALEKIEETALSRHLNYATRIDDQIATSAVLSAKKAGAAWKAAGGLGGTAMTSFQNTTITAFKNIGAGTQSVTDAMKAMFLTMIGEVASKQGEAIFLSSFESWPIWPTPKTAGGLALIALGGALGAAAGGGASVSGAAGGGGGYSSGGGGGGAVAPGSLPASSSTASPGKSVSIVVQGHMLMGDQTQKWLVDQIRAASDATDFRVQVGTGPGL